MEALLEKGKEVKFKNRLQGYGLKDSDFDSATFENGQNNCSRRIFGYRKASLLKRKLIVKLHFRSKRENYYSITPLGVCYFCSLVDSITKQQAKRILENLKLFYESRSFGKEWLFDIGAEFNFSKIWDKLEKVILDQELINELKRVCSYVTIKNEDDDHVVTCSFPIHNAMMVTISKYKIFNDKTVKELHQKIRKKQKKNPNVISDFTDIYSDTSYPGRESRSMSELSPAGFFYWISMFILYAFHFNLVKGHIDKFDTMLSQELEREGKVKRRKLKRCYSELQKLSLYEYDVIKVARRFSNNLNFFIDEVKLDLEQFENTVEQYQSGELPETPTYIETASKVPIIKLKRSKH